MFGCAGSSLWVGTPLAADSGDCSSCGVQAAHLGGFSSGEACALGQQAQQLWRPGLAALQHGGFFPDQGPNPCLLHGQADSSTTEPPGSRARDQS